MAQGDEKVATAVERTLVIGAGDGVGLAGGEGEGVGALEGEGVGVTTLPPSLLPPPLHAARVNIAAPANQ